MFDMFKASEYKRKLIEKELELEEIKEELDKEKEKNEKNKQSYHEKCDSYRCEIEQLKSKLIVTEKELERKKNNCKELDTALDEVAKMNLKLKKRVLNHTMITYEKEVIEFLKMINKRYGGIIAIPHKYFNKRNAKQIIQK